MEQAVITEIITIIITPHTTTTIFTKFKVFAVVTITLFTHLNINFFSAIAYSLEDKIWLHSIFSYHE